MREYETTIIIQPEISDEGAATILDRAVGIIEKHGDTRLCCEDLGKRKLAYEIRKFHKGHYFILSHLGEGASVPDVERSLRLDESVLRFLTVQVTDRVVDVEARKAVALEFEKDQAKRADEKAAREAESREREEAERVAAAEAAEAAAKLAAEAAAEAAAESAAEASEDAASDAPAEEAPTPEAAGGEVAVEPTPVAEPAEAASDEEEGSS